MSRNFKLLFTTPDIYFSVTFTNEFKCRLTVISSLLI